MYMPLYLYSCPSCSITLEELRPASRADDRFNPRARVGRDCHVVGMQQIEGRFNPRARVGRDAGDSSCCSVHNKVSIHAPAWGATDLV